MMTQLPHAPPHDPFIPARLTLEQVLGSIVVLSGRI